MSVEKLRPSFTFNEERIEQLKAVVPEAFADGKINWDVLKEALGEFLEPEEASAEHFALTWPGKREARRLASLPSQGSLYPAYGEGINEDTTRNVFVEGDNLEVLKLLQKSYAGRIKFIYIDPPYNTGGDFIYEDDFSEPLESYLIRTSQMSESGELLTTNTRSSGRFHSNWLNMMYPRLLLARSLLRTDGVIFVSIDDDELHHLLLLMNEVFGSENYLGTFVWQSKKGGGSDNAGLVNDQEYIVCFAKLKTNDTLSRISVDAEPLDKKDEKGPYRRGRELNKWGSNSRREDRPTMFFPIPGPNNEDVYPIRNDGTEGCWRWGKKKMFAAVEKGNVEFVPREDGTYIVYEKIRSEDPRTKPYRTWLTDIGATSDGSKKVKELFDGKKVFDFPKPVELLKHLLELGTTEDDDLVLDFFAGSATTAQAVFEYNRENETILPFICVQMPEPVKDKSEAQKAGFKTVSEVGIERIKRSIKKLVSESDEQLPLDDRDEPEDLGFRIFKLDRSNYRVWQNYDGKDIQALQHQLDMFETPLHDDWQEHDLLVEILLLQGFTLDSEIVVLEQFTKNTLHKVESGFHAHRLFVCLDRKVEQATIDQLDLNAEDIFVCLDSALTDTAKMRLADVCNLRVI